MATETLLPPLPVEVTRATNNPIALTSKDITQRLRNRQRALTPAEHATILDQHQDYLDGLSHDQQAILKYLKQLASVPGIPPPPDPAAASLVIDYVLVAGTLITPITTTLDPDAPVQIGDQLHAFVQAKGPFAMLEWGPTVMWGSTEFDSTEDTWTIFNFVARVDPDDSILKWFFNGNPVTGQPIPPP